MGENACDDVFDWAARDPGRVTFSRPADSGWAPVTVPLYETSSVEQIRWILGDCGAVAVFAGTASLADAIRRAQAATVEAVWVLDRDLNLLACAGVGVTPGELLERRGAVAAGTLATVVYTSGTTGQPKGCMISHGNLAGAVRAMLAAPGIRDGVLAEDASSLLFLPLSHILARVVALCLVHVGKRIGYLGDLGELPAGLASFRPTILVGVPRVFEKIAAAASQQAEAEGHQRLFAAAQATANDSKTAGHGCLLLRMRHAVFGRLVYRRLREGAGGRVAWAFSGGAPLGTDLAHFFRGTGITILEGWGLTETAGPVTYNLPGAQRIGSDREPVKRRRYAHWGTDRWGLTRQA